MVTESLADNLTPFEAIGVGRARFEAYWSNFTALLAQASPAIRAENQVLRGLLERDLADRDLRQVPAVPMVVLVAAKYFAVPSDGSVRSPKAFPGRPALSAQGPQRMGSGIAAWHPGDGEQHDSHHPARGSGSHRVGCPAGTECGR